MNKKILIGLSVIGSAAGFWACGDGDVIAKGGDEDLALLSYGPPLVDGDEGNMKTLVNQAMADCAADEACAAKMEGSTYTPPESSAEGGEGGGDTPASSASGPVSNGSGPVVNTSSGSGTPTGSSGSGSDNPPPSSAATVTDANVLDGTCTGTPNSVEKATGVVTWKFTPATLDVNSLSGSYADKITQQTDYKKRVEAATCNWTLEGATVKTGNVAGTCGGDGATITATYANIGNYSASIKLGEKTIACTVGSGTKVAATGSPVTGCTCDVDDTKPDVKNGPVTVTWTVSGCKAGTAAQGDGWKYTWTGPTGSTATAIATVSKKNETKTASVVVTSPENASMEVKTCPSVKAQNIDEPDYELKKKVGDDLNQYLDLQNNKCEEEYCVKVPNGQTVLLSAEALNGTYIRCLHGYQSAAFSFTISSGKSKKDYSTTGNNGIYWPQDNESFPVSNLVDSAFSVEMTGITEVYCIVK